MIIYFWSIDQTGKYKARMMSINSNLVCTVFLSLDACSVDIATNPFTLFWGTAVMKCNKSKFNHRAKVSVDTCCCDEILALPNLVELFHN